MPVATARIGYEGITLPTDRNSTPLAQTPSIDYSRVIANEGKRDGRHYHDGALHRLGGRPATLGSCMHAIRVYELEHNKGVRKSITSTQTLTIAPDFDIYHMWRYPAPNYTSGDDPRGML